MQLQRKVVLSNPSVFCYGFRFATSADIPTSGSGIIAHSAPCVIVNVDDKVAAQPLMSTVRCFAHTRAINKHKRAIMDHSRAINENIRAINKHTRGISENTRAINKQIRVCCLVKS